MCYALVYWRGYLDHPAWRDDQENIAVVVTENRLASLHKARVYDLGVYHSTASAGGGLCTVAQLFIYIYSHQSGGVKLVDINFLWLGFHGFLRSSHQNNTGRTEGKNPGGGTVVLWWCAINNN